MRKEQVAAIQMPGAFDTGRVYCKWQLSLIMGCTCCAGRLPLKDALCRLKNGEFEAFLPPLHFVLTQFSRQLTKEFLQAGNKASIALADQSCMPCVIGAWTLLKPTPWTDLLTKCMLAQLLGNNDHRFVESAFRIARDHLGLRTVVTLAQFFERVRYACPHTSMLCCPPAGCLLLEQPAGSCRNNATFRQLQQLHHYRP